MVDDTMTQIEIVAERDRLVRDRIDRLRLGRSPTHEQLHRCATEIAAALALPNADADRRSREEMLYQVAALSAESLAAAYARERPDWSRRVLWPLNRQFGAHGEHVPLRDPLGRPWTLTTFFGFVAGTLFSLDTLEPEREHRPRWRFGPNAERVWGAASGRHRPGRRDAKG